MMNSQCDLESLYLSIETVGLTNPLVQPSAPWTQPSHQSTPVLLGLNQATGPPRCSFGLIQATGPPLCSFGFIQATSPPQCFLRFMQATGPSQCSLRLIQATGLPVYSLGLIQATGSVEVIQLHCTSLQCNLHFFTYTLAMQRLVNAYIQHPSKYPSRYIIPYIGIGSLFTELLKSLP
jgi:hypothetical protein